MKCGQELKPRDCFIYEKRGSCNGCKYIVFDEIPQDRTQFTHERKEPFTKAPTSRKPTKEVCEWIFKGIDEEGVRFMVKCGGSSNNPKQTEQGLCPYCTKPIKIKGE